MSNELIKITAVIIITAVFVTALRCHLGEYSILLVIAAIAVVMISLLSNLFGAANKLNSLFLKSGNTAIYFTTALKALGISYIVTFAADLCRDFGLSALAQTAELTGKITVFLLSLPLMTSLLETVLKFIGL